METSEQAPPSARPAVLFDLGNTLVAYYERDEFVPVLRAALARVGEVLRAQGRAARDVDEALPRALAENREAGDHRVAPLAPRLERIFGTKLGEPALVAAASDAFLQPIFAMGRVYADARPVLEGLRALGCPLAIVSNTPWGSPPEPWRRELARLGFAELVDRSVFCGDVGWRKPAASIFEHAAAALGRRTADCLFVGDDPVWDAAGGAAAGMRAVLLDRRGIHADFVGERIRDLRAVLDLVRGMSQASPS